MRTGKKLLALLLALVMAMSLTVTAFAEGEDAAGGETAPVTETTNTETAGETEATGGVTILYTNDVHTYIDNDYEVDETQTLPVIRYSTVAGYKATLENVLLVDAGDAIQGTAYGGMDDGATITKLMNAVGYDLATLGNHEFDYGMAGCMAAIEAAEFPYVSCNFYHEKDGVKGENVLDSYKVFEVNGVKIAFVGITTPESFTKSTPAYFQDENGNYIYGIAGGEDGEALYAAVQTAIDAASAEADYVIGLGHLGVDESSKPWTSKEVIANTTGLDAFIDGHSHSSVAMEEVKDEAGNTVILTQTGSYLDALGQMTIAADGTITTKLLTAADLAAVTPDAEVKAIEDAWVTEIDTQLGEVIGHISATLDNYDAEGVRLVRKQETNTGDFAADALYYLFDSMDMDVDVAIMNGGGIRNEAITGDISYQTCKLIHTFGNVACLQTVTGQQILDALEWGAKDVAADGSMENGGFLQVSGLKYTINTAIPSTVQKDEKGVWTGGPTGEYRVTDVQVLNKETGEYEALDLAASYNLAGYNYTLRDLGDGFAMFKGAVNVLDYVAEDYMVLATYVQSFENGEVTGYEAPAGRITIVNEPATQEPEAPAGYTDVTEANWYYEAVTYVTENKLMAGKTDATFAPTAPITGAELTAALEAVASSTAVADGETVTREALAVLLWNRAGKPEAQADLSAFADGASVSEENQAAVAWAVAEGLLKGNADGTLDLDGLVTRAQAATVVMRLHQAAPEAAAEETPSVEQAA